MKNFRLFPPNPFFIPFSFLSFKLLFDDNQTISYKIQFIHFIFEMNPNQQPLLNPQMPSPYRHNYHINPAESKIIYKNPQNTHQLGSPNHINLIQIQNPQSVPTHYINTPSQMNPMQIPMQGHLIQDQQARSRSLSPIKGFPPQNVYQNQRVMVQSPPPYSVPYPFQSPPHQNMIPGPQPQSIIPGPRILNQAIQHSVQGNLFQPTQNPVHYMPQNNMPVNNTQMVRAPSPSIGTTGVSNMTVSNSSGVNFSYHNQLKAVQHKLQNEANQTILQSQSYAQNPILNGLTSVFQKNMGVSQNKPMLQSAISINLNSGAKRIQESAININMNSGAQRIQESVVNVNLKSVHGQNSNASNIPTLMVVSQNELVPIMIQQKAQSMQQKTQPIFSLTQSYVPLNRTEQVHASVKSPQMSPVPPALNHIPPQIHQTSENYTQNVEQISSNPIWEQRFIMIYQKFEWFYERYDFISREFQILSQEFENVNSQDEWLELKQKHDLLLEKIQEIQQQLVNTIHQNQQLAEQYELQNRNSKQSDQVQRVWQHRYHQLLEQYKSLSQNYADLQSQGNNQNTSQSQHSQNKGGMTIEEQAEMQGKFHQLENQYNVLCEQYEKIRIEYERIYEENTHYAKENNDLMTGQQQARNMASQLQAYVQELQQQNDQLRKQQRKSAPSQQNYIPRQQFQKMQYHFGQEIQKYQDELQKYRMALQQYEQKTQMNRQELQKISEIAMERQNRIRQLQNYQNSNSKSGHSNVPVNENHDLQRKYVNILEQDVKLWREKETDFLHKLELKDMERRSLEEKIHYLEKQLDTKKLDLDRLSKNLNEKLSKIEQNTSTQIQGASRHIIQEQVVRPLGSTQYEAQIHELQSQLHELQNVFNSKMSTYRELQQSISNYESQLRKKSTAQTTAQIEFQKRISELQIDFNRKIAEKDMKITVLNSQIQRLKDSCDNLNKEKHSVKQSLRAEFVENEKQLNQRHNSRVAEMEKKVQEKSSQVAYLKQILQKYEKELKMKNDQLIELRNFVNQMKKSSSSTNIAPGRNDYNLIKQQLKLKQQILQRKNQQLSKIKRQKEYKVKHITQLQHELEQVNSELSKRRSEVSSLKRQLNDMQGLESQFESVKSGLTKKTLEINQLKQELFEVDKLRMENESQKRDLERAIHQNKDKYKEIEKLKEQNYELERKLAFSKTNHSTANNVTSHSRYQGGYDDSEVSQLRELIRKKDSQISRINQSLQQTQYLLQNRSRQLQMHKSQLSALTKSRQSQVSSLSHNISSLESRLKDSEMKRTKLVEQTNELRSKFEEQLKAQSQRQKVYYEKVITRHEDDYKGFKEKLRASEQACNKMEMELEKSRTSEKNLQIQLSELNKKLLAYQSQTLQKQELFSTFRQKQAQSEQSTKALYEKLSALELQLKTKQQQMKLSQEKNAILEQKIKKTKKDHEAFKNKLIVSQQYKNNNSVVEYLSKRIAQYESKMINQSEKDFGFKVKDQEANYVFENQIVYHLKIENQMLRRELQGKGIQYDRKVLNQLQEQNLKRSKNLLRNSAFSSKLGNISSNLLIKDNMQDVNFYKQKNKQLQERVQKHLKCNKQLKEKIQMLIKGSQNKQAQYYKEQITEYEHKISQLEKKVHALTEQNKNINKGMSKRQSRVEEHYEDRVKQMQARINQMTKTIEQLSQQKSDLEISKSQLQMQKVTLNDQIKRLNEKISTLQSSKNQKYQQQVDSLRQKCENYESEITKISNRARILEQQIKRLNEMNTSSKQSLNQLNSLKLKIQELTNLLTKAERQLQEEQARSNSLSNQVASLQLKCRTWESETQRLKEMNELYAKKQRNDLSQSTVLKQSTNGLQAQINTLQAQLSGISHEKHELQMKISSMIQQLRYYESLIPSLVYDLEFIRSDTLVEETLIEEMVIGGDNTAECIDALRVNVQRKMYWLDQLFNKVRKL